jgi:preprotein translocase subunit SecA
MNKQREIVYKKRKKILEIGESEKEEDKETLKNEAMDILINDVENFVNIYSPEGEIEPDKEKILQEFVSIVPFDENSQKQIQEQMAGLHGSVEIKDFLIKILTDVYSQREKALGKDLMRQVERWIMLSVIDNLWMDHLDAVDDLREGIGLRGYGQRDPLVEYKSEAFSMFEKLMAAIDSEIARRIFKVQVAAQPTVPQKIYATPAGGSGEVSSSPTPIVHSAKIGRNDPCWCKSGKKWKKCHYPDPGPTQ